MSERRTDEIESGSWPTADTVMRKSRKAMTASTENGRRSGDGNSSPPGLEQAVEIVAGTIPPEMQGIHLPPATERFIGMAKRSWTTPRAGETSDQASRKGMFSSLSAEVQREWLTPTSGDANGSGAAGYSTESGRHSGTTLTDATSGPRGPEKRNTPGRPRGYLNPRWVLQLQGFPATYLDGVEVP